MKLRPRKTFIIALTVCAAAANAALWAVVWFGFPPLATTYVIRYSVLSGADIIGTRADIFIVPLAGLVILIMNAVIAFLMKKREPLISYALIFSSALIQFFLTVALIGLLTVNSRI